MYTSARRQSKWVRRRSQTSKSGSRSARSRTFSMLSTKSNVEQEASQMLDPTEEPIEFLTRFNVSELVYDDVEEVRKLCDDQVKQIYNVEDPFDTIHRCYLSLKLTTSTDKIVGIICLDEYPNVPGLPQVGWSNWADSLYNIKDLTSYNSLWVHLVAYDKRYKMNFLHPMLNWLFHEYMVKIYCLFVIPKSCHELVKYLDGVSSLVLPQNFSDPMQVQTLRLCVRQDFITNYKIRRAVEEDNDDLVPLIHEFSPRFIELYGEYYVAEIITRHPEAGRKIIVAELDGEAVSVLCLNPEVNYDQLNECFDLHVFTGLYKAETAKQEAHEYSPHRVRMEEPSLEESEKSAVEDVAKVKIDKSYTKNLADIYGATMFNFGSPDVSEEAQALSPEHPGLTFSVLDDIDRITTQLSSSSSLLLNLSHKFAEAESEIISEPSIMSLESASTSSELPFVGVENAFAIEILAAQSKHQPSLPLLIVSCFECYQNRDYCLLMLPHDADYSPILAYFVRVQPRLQSQHPHELYVCHRGQLSDLRVLKAFKYDAESVYNFIDLLKYPGNLRSNYDNSFTIDKNNVQTFIALSGRHRINKTPVGLAQVARVTDLTSIKMKYALAQRTDFRRDGDFSFGYLVAFCLSPLFKRHLKFFMREVHRKTTYQTIFYALNHHDETDYRIRPMSIAMHEMWLVPPRKIRVSLKKVINEYPEEPYALFISTPKLMSKPLIEVNHRIVVVGASTTALSFLEVLLNNELTERLVVFNNVILVSTNGFGHSVSPNPITNMLLCTKSIVDAQYLEKIALRARISNVNGTLTGINRKEKCVYIDSKVVIPYEYLFLMTGLQYGVPQKKNVKEYTKVKLPANCFTINNETDGDRALEKLKALIAETKRKPYEIVIYGYAIDCFCCIAALIEFGIPPKYIKLIQPWPRNSANNHDFIFQDGVIYETVVETITSLGVDIRSGYILIDWSSRPLTLKFESLTRYLLLTPLCAFIYGEKSVDIHVFNAIYESGLVFDGRLVIDPECRTNDPNIFAAGPLTKYSRKLWADHLAHKYFNAEEIGAHLGKKIRAMLLPFKEKLKTKFKFGRTCWQQTKHQVPYYYKPLIKYCRLPGGLYYLKVCKPGPQVPLETDMSDTDYGSVLSTGNCKNLKFQGYFRMHLNIYRTVETITCLSLQKFDYHKLFLLWGKHEAVLNNLVRRFEAFFITDLFEYFKKPWCSAIFLDDFPFLESAIMKVMTSLSEVPGESPLEDLYRYYQANGFKPLNAAERNEINNKFNDSEYEKQIQQLIMDYIRDNLGVLDMYAHPVIVNYVLSGYEESPMFKKI